MSRRVAAGASLSRRRLLIDAGGLALVAAGGAACIHVLQPAVEARGRWYKNPQSPVLGGTLGTCFDVSVRREGNHYQMWFSWRPTASIGYVESADGLHWDQPRIALGPDPTSGWEDAVNRPIVLRRSNGYHMWYTGQTPARSAIGYATSADGLTWRRRHGRPVLAADARWEQVSVMCPHVLWDDQVGLYRMWYSGGPQDEPNAIGFAVSPDGISWEKLPDNPIFRPGESGDWDAAKVTACHVEPVQDGYLMFYAGFRDLKHAQIGLARSTDGISGWRRHRDNPIIRPGGLLAWDRDAVYKPSVVHQPGLWQLWYNGRAGSTEQIGRALHDGDDLGL